MLTLRPVVPKARATQYRTFPNKPTCVQLRSEVGEWVQLDSSQFNAMRLSQLPSHLLFAIGGKQPAAQIAWQSEQRYKPRSQPSLPVARSPLSSTWLAE